MRLFIAINFPEKVRSEIEKTREESVAKFPQVAWTKKENIHLTIKFLGHIKNESIVEKIKEGIEKSTEGIKPFELVFDKIGYFAREQLIIWLGAKTDPQLQLLVKRLDGEMEKLGFRKERKEFAPHITLGRGKRLDSKILQEIKQAINSSQFVLPKPFFVSQIILMNSTLSPKGPVYNPISQFALS
jgi:2'-5' RNA ligase